MTTEMQMLLAAAFLGLLHIFISAGAATTQRGLRWNASARDGIAPTLTGVPARLDRALQNFKETFPIFAVAVLIVRITAQETSLSALGAQMYFWSRVVYIPFYAFGVPFARTAVWFVSVVGIAFILIAGT